MTGDAKSIGTFVSDPHSVIGALMARADALCKFQQALLEWQPGTPLNALRAVNLRKGVLVIHADNASALTILRYRQKELLKYLQTHGYQCSDIEAKVAPHPKRS